MLTIDEKHNQMMLKFNDEEKIIANLKKRKKSLNQIIKKESNIKNKIKYQDELIEVKDQIKKLQNDKTKYLLNNAKTLHDYFETKKDEAFSGSKKVKVVSAFFNKNKNTKVNEIKKETFNDLLQNKHNKHLNMEQYKYNSILCKCGGELIPIHYEGMKVCNTCGRQEKYIIEHEKNNYKEPPKEVCFYAYKRINHFKEILAQFQAKETTQISQEILNKIKAQIKKERLSLENLTNAKCKDILNKLGYNKYYEHISFIKDKLGIKPPIMSQELEEKLCMLFIEIEKQYAKHCPNNRVNFLNYYYVLYKLCELLEETHFLPHFPMLKDPIKRIEQDVIWKKICQELNWKFIPII